MNTVAKVETLTFKLGKKTGFVEVLNGRVSWIMLSPVCMHPKGSRVSSELGRAINGVLLTHGYAPAYKPDPDSESWMDAVRG